MDGNEKCEENEKVCFKLDSLSPPIYKKITKLDLSGQKLCQVPEPVANLKNLKSLILSNNDITHIPNFIQRLHQLEELIARNNKLHSIYNPTPSIALHDEKVDTAFEDSIYTEDELNTSSPSPQQQSISEFDWSSLPQLSTIDLSDNQFHEFPRSLCKARNIVKLDLSGNPIRCLPLMFKSYNIIRHLTLERIEFTHLFELPYWLFNLKRCTVLSLAYSCVGSLMESFPNDVGYVCRLITKLDLRGAGLRDFPECVVSMLDLEYLWLSNPVTRPKLNPLSEINMNVNMVWQIPCKLGSLTALTHFEVCNVRLSIIPSSFCSLINLCHFNACCNAIESLPKQFFDLVNLTYLNLSDNDLVFLPNGLKKLVKLNVLNLGYNKIYDVRELQHLHSLQELDLYSNRLSEVDLPQTLLKLDLAKNKICQQYLTEKFGQDYLANYQNIQDSLRKSLDPFEMRDEVVEKIEEHDYGSDNIYYNDDNDIYEDDSLDIFANELHPDLNNQPANPNPGDGTTNDDQAEQTDEEEDWNEFIPVRRSTHRVKSKLYKSYPDSKSKDAVFCPAESHPLSLVKTTSTARASSINQRHPEIQDPNGIFEDAD